MRNLSLVLIVLICFAAPALATTINVTNGTLGTSQFALWDTCVNIPVFHISNNCTESAFSFFPPGLADGTAATFHYVSGISIDGVWYPGPDPGGFPGSPSARNLNMHFNFEPVPDVSPTFVLGEWVVPDVYSKPFTMVGTLALLDPNNSSPIIFDVSGQGILDRYWQMVPFRGDGGAMGITPVLTVNVTFAPVPESSSILLLVTSAVPLFLLVRHWRSR
jgi:hypothetical protein